MPALVPQSMAGAFKLMPDERGFSRANALALAEAAELAYDKPEVIRRKVTDEWQLTGFEFIESGSMQAFVARAGSVSVVAFRGTDDARDWLANADTRMETTTRGRVHRGFREALAGLRDRILAAAGTSPAFVTGHSLGGALAVLMAAEFADHHVEIAGLYTFGQPKVGDRAFARAFDGAFKDRYFRFVNNNDGVPRLPAWSGYRHAGTLFYFGVTGKLYREPSWWLLALHTAVGWVILFADWLEKRAVRLSSFEAYADHAMRWYLANLRNLE